MIVAGRVVEDIFIKYFDRKNMSFKLKEHYGMMIKVGLLSISYISS